MKRLTDKEVLSSFRTTDEVCMLLNIKKSRLEYLMDLGIAPTPATFGGLRAWSQLDVEILRGIQAAKASKYSRLSNNKETES
jgi:DNA-binding transcriptional MerR regulator